MRAAPIHRLAHALAALAMLGVLTVTSCGTLDNAQQVIDRADLVNDLAARLDRSSELTYSAEYQLSGGNLAVIAQAQEPPRASYTYPGGKLTITAEATAACATANGATSCTLSLPSSPNTKPAASLFADAGRRGLATPTVVIGLLTAAALDTESVIKQHDTTIAGQHATCVDVQNVKNAAASEFDACITTDGVLGSFTGVVNGSPIDLSMTRYRWTVDADAFDLPAGAKVVDRRPEAK